MKIFLILNMLNSAKRMGNCNPNFVSLVGGNVFCYANSLFQCLNNMNPVPYFFKNDPEASTPFDILLQEVFNMLELNKGKLVDIRLLYEQVINSINNTNFTSTSFNDPFEFLTLILSHRDNQSTLPIYTTTSNQIALKKNKLNDIFIYETEKKKDYFILFKNDKSIQETVFDLFEDDHIDVYPKILIFQHINEQINNQQNYTKENNQQDNTKENNQQDNTKEIEENNQENSNNNKSDIKIEEVFDLSINEESFNIMDIYEVSLFDDKLNNDTSLPDEPVPEIKIEENNLIDPFILDNLQLPNTFESEILINDKIYTLNSLIINVYNASHYYAIIRYEDKFYKVDDEIITEIYDRQFFGDIYTDFYEISNQ